MKLFEHPDFEQAIIQAAEYFRPQGLRPAIIEKDHYVTEALRSIANLATGSASGNAIISAYTGGASRLPCGSGAVCAISASQGDTPIRAAPISMESSGRKSGR